MSIGDFAQRSGVNASALRFYESLGLIESVRSANGRRRYHRSGLRRIAYIVFAQRVGFTLEEIRQLLALDSGEDRAAAREMATKRLAELDARMKDLQRARASLQTLVSECAVGKKGPCPILKSFET